jgi:3-methyl-2-oxobutanoate hydroxymethyltransferase
MLDEKWTSTPNKNIEWEKDRQDATIKAGIASNKAQKDMVQETKEVKNRLTDMDNEEAEKLISDSKKLEEAGCFALVLEKIPAHLATKVAENLNIPVIGIGAGNGVDGQVLVLHDMLGINNQFNPRFLRRYLNLYEDIKGAVGNYISDVKSKDFPSEKESY